MPRSQAGKGRDAAGVRFTEGEGGRGRVWKQVAELGSEHHRRQREGPGRKEGRPQCQLGPRQRRDTDTQTDDGQVDRGRSPPVSK